jgi:hypothetical protein
LEQVELEVQIIVVQIVQVVFQVEQILFFQVLLQQEAEKVVMFLLLQTDLVLQAVLVVEVEHVALELQVMLQVDQVIHLL